MSEVTTGHEWEDKPKEQSAKIEFMMYFNDSLTKTNFVRHIFHIFIFI